MHARVSLVYVLMMIMSTIGASQEPRHAPTDTPHPRMHTLAPIAVYAPTQPPENQDDPAYKTYKEGYNLVLDEKWSEARKKFQEVTSKYPKSEYVDDAEYWSAYALRHIDSKKGREAYMRFMEKYPQSRYYDDAVADLADVASNVVFSTTADSALFFVDGKGKGYAYAIGDDLRRMEREMRRAEQELRWQGRRWASPPITPRPALSLMSPGRREKLDRDTQLKMDALHAIGDAREDEKAFNTLKEVALDTRASLPLRETALMVLSDFKKFDVYPIFLELAKRDTNEAVQTMAIHHLGEVTKNKDQSVDLLSELFNTTPKQRTSQLETILFTVADIGNDRAVEFLSRVARTHENYDLRSQSVFLLGNIGTEKARGALYQILTGK